MSQNSSALPLIRLNPCPKSYTTDLDKAIPPHKTLERIHQKLASLNLDILAKTRRVDVGRLGIPVFMSICGKDALGLVPTRKQMGKGSSPEQAEASACMELIERFSYFSFWKRKPHFTEALWSEAKNRFGEQLIAIEEITRSVHEDLDPRLAETLMDLIPWNFAPATELQSNCIRYLPLDWFRLLNEFNGTSAGNSQEESLLQGLCELIERHVCALIDEKRSETPTISLSHTTDPVLQKLAAAFEREGITLILKDFSLDLPVPTIGAIAYDPKTFPDHSEIVFTAGTAPTPTKAAIRAITEIAQLGGDFCTNSCYEASGLPKFKRLEDIQWLIKGSHIPIDSVTNFVSSDITADLIHTVTNLAPFRVYAISTTHPLLEIPAHYTIVPGFSFRERDKNQSLGLFIGRRLIEECDSPKAVEGLHVLENIYGEAHFIPFFQGMLFMQENDFSKAEEAFAKALPLQPDRTAKGLVSFYQGYACTQRNAWNEAIPKLQEAIRYCPEMKESCNLLGVSYFKTKQYAHAKQAFLDALSLDKGSAMDLANLGLCERYLGEYDNAESHLKAALELDPSIDFARDHYNDLQKIKQSLEPY